VVRHGRGRRQHDRSRIARAFLAKAIFNLPHTRALLERLAHDEILRRLCGWDTAAEVPDETVMPSAPLAPTLPKPGTHVRVSRKIEELSLAES